MNRIINLLYHRVGDYENDIYNMSVSKKNFYEEMEFLANNYNIVRFDDDWNNVRENSIVISFDDGYKDNYENAVPILEKFNIPATFFISTAYIETDKEFWWDELLRCCIHKDNDEKSFELNDDVFRYKWDTVTQEDKIEMAISIRHLLRREPSMEIREDWIKQLQTWAGLSPLGREEHLAMNKSQIKRIADNSLFTVGGHTVTHRSLGALEYDEQLMECRDSINTLEFITNKKIDVFSYPFGGKNDYSSITKEILKNVGITKAATTIPNVFHDESIFEIPRITVRNMNLIEFKSMIKEAENSYD